MTRLEEVAGNLHHITWQLTLAAWAQDKYRHADTITEMQRRLADARRALDECEKAVRKAQEVKP
jgi:hypothetical protein